MITRRILPIPMSVLPNSYGAALSLTMDEDYIIRGQLLDQHGEPLGEEQVIDTPLEMSIIGGTYDDQTQSLILELQNGDTISIPISSLISGLQEEITAQNPLSADLLTDGTNNKVFTAAEQTKLSNIAAGAEVNVQANWNESDSSSDSYIQNKPTLGTMAAENASDYTPTSSLANVALSGSYTDLSNTPTLGTMAAENASDYTPTSSLSTVATTGSYTDLSNTPDLSVYAQLAGNNTFTGENSFTEAATFTSEYATETNVHGQGFETYFSNHDDNGTKTVVGMYSGMPEITGETEYEEPELWVCKDTLEVEGNAITGTYEEVLVRPTEIILHTMTYEDDGQGGEPVQTDTQHVVINQEGIEIDGNAVVTSDQLAQVATTGSYTDLSNTPTIPTVNDATITLQDGNGTALGSFTTNDANNQTITIPAGGGGGNEWFGTQAQFDALSSYDADTDYFISDKIDYNTDIKNKPNLSVYAVKTQVDAKNIEQDSLIANKMEGTFLTEQEYSQITPKEGENYFIEGTTVQMEVTFSDQTTATYNVVID